MLHEARGLDVFPLTLKKFRNSGDEKSIEILEKNVQEEIFHVATGLKWFTFLCNDRHQYNSDIEAEFNGKHEPIEIFHAIVRKYHSGILKKGSLNMAARSQAGMTDEWFENLYT